MKWNNFKEREDFESWFCPICGRLTFTIFKSKKDIFHRYYLVCLQCGEMFYMSWKNHFEFRRYIQEAEVSGSGSP